MPFLLLSVITVLSLAVSLTAHANCGDRAVVCLEDTGKDSADVESSRGSTSETRPTSEAIQQSLIDGITADLKARRLSRPKGNSAADKIRRLKAVMPDHDYAQNGERYIARIYMSLGRSAMKQGDVELAERRLQLAINFDKRVSGKQALIDQIVAVQKQAATAVKKAPVGEKPQYRNTDNGISTEGIAASEKQPLIAPIMVAIPAGKFVMGSESGAEDEKPMHEVTIEAFSMSRYEITLEQFRLYAVENNLPAPQYKLEDANRPVANVSWEDATDYSRWLRLRTGKPYRLATEAEWEYAARAGSVTPYHAGEDLLHMANCANCADENNTPQSTPVGSFPANEFGLYDMHGNVWEWVQDCWTDNYFGRGDNSAAIIKNGCDRHVLRGGSWANTADYARSSYRGNERPSYRHDSVGFRVVHDGL